MSKKKLVAVYGTLKRGYGNHRWAEADGAEFVSTGHTRGEYTMHDGGFPMVKTGGEDRMLVDVLEIDGDPVHMDRLEGHPSHFRRELIDVYLHDRAEWAKAWMYMYQYESSNPIIHEGSWPQDHRVVV